MSAQCRHQCLALPAVLRLRRRLDPAARQPATVGQAFPDRSWFAGQYPGAIPVARALRGLLFGRLALSAINGVQIVSGAFGLFRNEAVIAVIAVVGYRPKTIGEAS